MVSNWIRLNRKWKWCSLDAGINLYFWLIFFHKLFHQRVQQSCREPLAWFSQRLQAWNIIFRNDQFENCNSSKTKSRQEWNRKYFSGKSNGELFVYKHTQHLSTCLSISWNLKKGAVVAGNLCSGYQVSFHCIFFFFILVSLFFFHVYLFALFYLERVRCCCRPSRRITTRAGARCIPNSIKAQYTTVFTKRFALDNNT